MALPSSVLVLGARGLVGTEVTLLLERRGVAVETPSRAECDLAIPEAALRVASRAALAINCAALNAVDKIETDPALRATADLVNARAPGHIARVARRAVHFSSDFVFDGTKDTPYVEEDVPAPLSAYGETKLAGDRAVLACPGGVVVRTGCLFGRAGRGFTSSLLPRLRAGERVRADAERRVRPTWAGALAEQTLAIAESEHAGLFHAMCSGETTWAGFARELARLAGFDPRLVEATPTAALASPAARPNNAMLDNARLARLGLDRMPRWEYALEAWLREQLDALRDPSRR
jgi:dTDP-4-dehydrorhamnose reductase